MAPADPPGFAPRLRVAIEADPALALSDSPLLAYEEIDYIASIGMIRTGIDGRMALR